MIVAEPDSRRATFTASEEIQTRPVAFAGQLGRAYTHRDTGATVPVVSIDIEGRVDLARLFAAYTPDVAGDIAVQWGRRPGASDDTVALFIEFIVPVAALVILEFDIVQHAGLVDGILKAGEFYLEGRGRELPPREVGREAWIRVVVPETGFAPIWEKLLFERLIIQAQKLGASPAQARSIAEQSIQRWKPGTN